MILPRGAFHSIKKGILLSELLHELKILRFSGLIIGSAEEINGAVVYEKGACILAEFGDLQGTMAWHEIISREDREFDVALSVFTEDQIGLSIEFNEQAVTEQVEEPLTSNKEEELSLPGFADLMQSAIAIPQGVAAGSEAGDLPQNKGGNFAVISDKNYPEGESQFREPVIDEIHCDIRELDPEELASKDLDSLDAKEIESMATRIRMNLKETMETLSLGYLMEERQH